MVDVVVKAHISYNTNKDNSNGFKDKEKIVL